MTKYEDLIALFDVALKKHGKVDSAVSNAGVPEIGDWFSPELDLESIKQVRALRVSKSIILSTLGATIDDS